MIRDPVVPAIDDNDATRDSLTGTSKNSLSERPVRISCVIA